MARDDDWGTESRLDRQNAAKSATRPPSRRHAATPRSWLRTLALPALICVILGGLAIYAMREWLQRG